LDPKRILSSTIFPRLSQIHYERLPKSINWDIDYSFGTKLMFARCSLQLWEMCFVM
jgi:hypothetical protein